MHSANIVVPNKLLTDDFVQCYFVVTEKTCPQELTCTMITAYEILHIASF